MANSDNIRLFVSVGSRFAMNRLLESTEPVLEKHRNFVASAQTGLSTFQSKHMTTEQWMNALDFDSAVRNCDIFISHAGMGNILLAAKHNKAIIVMPRRAELGEHINDHQLSTADAFKQRSFIRIAEDSRQLEQAAIELANNSNLHQGQTLSNQANSHSLISSLRQFIDNGTTE